MLSVLFNLVETISRQSAEPQLTLALYQEYRLLQVLATRLSLTEYRKRPNERKDIYAYLHMLVKTIISLTQATDPPADPSVKQTMQTIIDTNRAFWDALEAATH